MHAGLHRVRHRLAERAVVSRLESRAASVVEGGKTMLRIERLLDRGLASAKRGAAADPERRLAAQGHAGQLSAARRHRAAVKRSHVAAGADMTRVCQRMRAPSGPGGVIGSFDERAVRGRPAELAQVRPRSDALGERISPGHRARISRASASSAGSGPARRMTDGLATGQHVERVEFPARIGGVA